MAISVYKGKHRTLSYEVVYLPNTNTYYPRIENPHALGFQLTGRVCELYAQAKWEAVRVIEMFLEYQPVIRKVA